MRASTFKKPLFLFRMGSMDQNPIARDWSKKCDPEFNAVLINSKTAAEKCIHCYERVGEGKEPACVQTCITRCRTFGDLDDPTSEISRLVAQGDAWQLSPEYGTNPNCYYIGEF